MHQKGFSLLREAFRASGDIEVVDNCLHVRLDGLSAPRRTRAIAALCEELRFDKDGKMWRVEVSLK